MGKVIPVYYMNWLTAIVILLMWSISVKAQTVPAPPDIQTTKSCTDYLQATHEALQAEYKARHECMKSPAHFGMQQGCSSDGHLAPPSISAWPNCGNAEHECALIRAQNDAYDCLKHARRKSSESNERQQKLKEIADAQKQAKGLLDRAKNATKFIENPAAFMNEYIANRVDSQTMQGIFDRRGRLTGHGVTIAQETYDFLFDNTLGNGKFYNENPIVKAIQGSAADELRRIHSDVIFQSEQLIDDIQNFSVLSNTATTQSHSFQPTPISSQSSDSECSVLDGPNASDLAIDDPRRFENLIKLCNKK
jgi:hypothetical protein